MARQAQVFNDGIVDIYHVGNSADPGNMPKDKLTLKTGNLRFAELTVGMGRYWTALQTHARIERMIRVQLLKVVTVHDVAILDGQQYEIVQVQYPKNMGVRSSQELAPPCMDLSLERMEVAYETV